MVGLEALTACFVQTCIPHHQVKCCKQKQIYTVQCKTKRDLHSAMQCLFALVNVEIQVRVKLTF